MPSYLEMVGQLEASMDARERAHWIGYRMAVEGTSRPRAAAEWEAHVEAVDGEWGVDAVDDEHCCWYCVQMDELDFPVGLEDYC